MPWVYLGCIDRTSKTPVKPFVALISGHQDGQMISKVISHLEIDTEVGSSTSGGTEAILRFVKAFKQKTFHIAITPDGPRGPKERSKEGVIKLAELTAMPIYPIKIVASRSFKFKSWDEMFLPLPFSKVVMHIGSPIYVPKKLPSKERSKYCAELDKSLHSLGRN
jgi:lysophospholipid acyltransferase (LPLAT)-like uncharacterized protein